MNRRSFLDAMLKGAAAFTILPSAGRIWKAERWLPNNPSGTIIPWTDADMLRYNALPFELAKKFMSEEHLAGVKLLREKLLAEDFKWRAGLSDIIQQRHLTISGILIQ